MDKVKGATLVAKGSATALCGVELLLITLQHTHDSATKSELIEALTKYAKDLAERAQHYVDQANSLKTSSGT